ncbi:MAG: diaminopimelate decarboxylase [Patescibacteria group bacterium]|nr:diaminopimelate decarboxylase [Patescibacteria group bacterium]
MPVLSDSFLSFLCTNVPALGRRFGDPFIIHHGPEIRERVRMTNAAFSQEGLDFTELFAVKANPRLQICEGFICSEGAGTDCSSEAELMFSQEIGVPPERIMLSANNVPQKLYRLAQLIGCHINLDDLTCVRKVPDPFPATICCRLNPGKVLLPGEETGQIEFSKEGAKFGMSPEDLMEAWRIAIEERKAEAIGIHSMVLSNNLDHRKAVPVIQMEFDLLSEGVQKFGVPGAYVNIGGGLGIPYRPGDPDYDVPALARECARIAAGFEKKHGYKPKIYMESGRFMTGPSGVLVNRIENVYTKYGRRFLGVPIAMHAVPRVMLYPGEAYHHHIILGPDGAIKGGPLDRVSIVGRACEDNDRLCTDEPLPHAEEGDYVLTCSAGAHCVDQGSDYNWQLKPQELLIRDHGTVRRICLPQTYEGLTARQRDLGGSEHALYLGR